MDDTARDEILAKLADGIDGLTDSDEWARYLAVQAKFHRYSFGNVMLILQQCPNASRVMAYGKRDGSTGWLSLGRNVIKGEHAIRIFAPSTRKGTNDAGEEETKLIGFRLVPVFDMSQTEGDPLPEVCTLLAGADDAGAFARLVKVAEGMGWRVEAPAEIDGYPGANGLCEHGRKLISVASDRSAAQMVKSMAHELGHAILHGSSSDYRANRGLCELEAESVAYVVCQHIGLDTSDYTFGYVATWVGADKARDKIKASGKAISRAAKTIIDALESPAEAMADIAA